MLSEISLQYYNKSWSLPVSLGPQQIFNSEIHSAVVEIPCRTNRNLRCEPVPSEVYWNQWSLRLWPAYKGVLSYHKSCICKSKVLPRGVWCTVFTLPVMLCAHSTLMPFACALGLVTFKLVSVKLLLCNINIEKDDSSRWATKLPEADLPATISIEGFLLPLALMLQAYSSSTLWETYPMVQQSCSSDPT